MQLTHVSKQIILELTVVKELKNHTLKKTHFVFSTIVEMENLTGIRNNLL